MNTARWRSAVLRILSPPGHADEGRSAVLSSTGWLILDKILRMLVGLTLGVWIARYLGPEEYGDLSYATAFAALFGAVASLGLDGIVVRDLVKRPEDERASLGTAFLLKMLGGVLTAAAAIAAIRIIRPAPSILDGLVALLATSVVFQAFDVVDFWFQSKVDARPVVLARFVAFLFGSLMRVALILLGYGVLWFAGAVLVESALAGVALLYIYSAAARRATDWRVSQERAGQLLGDSWPLIFSTLVTILYMRIDQIMIGEMVDTREVGVYSVAVRLSEVWYVIPASIVATWTPSIVDAHKQGDEALFQSRLQRLYDIMALLAYAVAIPTIFVAGPVVELLFGAEYSRAAPMLIVLMFASLFINLGIARSAFLTSMNWPKTHFVTVLLGALTNVLLNFLLIPSYGGTGAAVASLISYWIAAHGVCYFIPRLRPTAGMLTKATFRPRLR